MWTGPWETLIRRGVKTDNIAGKVHLLAEAIPSPL